MKSAHSSWRDKALCASLLTALCAGAAYALKRQCSIPTAAAEVVQVQEVQVKDDCLSEVARQEQVIIEQVEQTHQLNKGLEDLLHSLRDGEAVLAGSPVENTY